MAVHAGIETDLAVLVEGIRGHGQNRRVCVAGQGSDHLGQSGFAPAARGTRDPDGGGQGQENAGKVLVAGPGQIPCADHPAAPRFELGAETETAPRKTGQYQQEQPGRPTGQPGEGLARRPLARLI